MPKKDFKTHREMRNASVLKVVHALQEGALNKKDIQASTNISWGSCSDIITQLQDCELIVPAKQAGSSNGKGRKATFFEFEKGKNLLLAMEIQPKAIHCTLANLGNEHLAGLTYPLPVTPRMDSLTNAIEQAFAHCLENFEIPADAVLALIFSLTGAVNTQELIWLRTPHIPEIQYFPFAQLKENLPQVRYMLANHDINDRARAVIESNRWDEQHYVFAHVSHGIGLAIQNEQGYYQGYRGFAGEIGHIPYPADLGKGQTLEKRLSVNSILTFIRKEMGEKMGSFEELEGNPICEDPRLFSFVFEPLLFLAVTVVNLYDPQTLILGGKALEPFYPSLQPALAEQLPQRSWLQGPEKILWYHEANTNCAFGAALNASSEVLSQYVTDLDL